MRAFLLLLLLPFLVPAAAAEEGIAVIYNDFAVDKVIYTLEDGRTLQVSIVGEKITATIGGQKFIVANGDCEEKKPLKVCVDSIELSHYNYSVPGRIVNKAKLRALEDIAHVEISQSIEPEKPRFGQEAAVTIVIANTGRRDAEHVILIAALSNAELVSLSSCESLEGKVVWEGTLQKETEQSCSFTIVAKRTKPAVDTSVTYHNGVEEEETKDKLSIALQSYPLDIRHRLNQSRVGIGNMTVLWMNVTAEKEAAVNLEITAPKGIGIVAAEEVIAESEARAALKTGLEEGQKKELSITLHARARGKHNISYTSEAIESGITHTMIGTIEVEVTGLQPSVRVQKTSFNSTADELRLLFINPESITVEEADIAIQTGLPLQQKRFSVARIGGQSHSEVSAAFNATPGTYPMNITVTYLSAYGETGTVEQEALVSIEEPAEEGNVTEITAKGNVTAGDEGNASAAAENAEETGPAPQKRKSGAQQIIFGAVILLIIGVLLRLFVKRGKPTPQF